MNDSTTPSFDRLARAYRWMEYLSFGTILERCRFRFLQECRGSRRALVLGDGDGRFTARLMQANRSVLIDAVDASPAMLQELRRRVAHLSPHSIARLQTIHADIRRFSPPGEDYDLVVSHFFLDCLTNCEVDELIDRTLPSLGPRCRWLVSEFCIPEKGGRRIAARLLVRWLYFAFHKLTHLQADAIPDYSAAFIRHGFCRQRQVPFLGGLLSAELWERKVR